MDFILELLFELFGQFILQFLFEALSEAGVHLFRRSRFFIHSHAVRVVSLVVTPLLAAGAMTLVGMWRSKRGEALVRLDKFTYAYVFAFSMAAVRFALAAT